MGTVTLRAHIPTAETPVADIDADIVGDDYDYPDEHWEELAVSMGRGEHGSLLNALNLEDDHGFNRHTPAELIDGIGKLRELAQAGQYDDERILEIADQVLTLTTTAVQRAEELGLGAEAVCISSWDSGGYPEDDYPYDSGVSALRLPDDDCYSEED